MSRIVGLVMLALVSVIGCASAQTPDVARTVYLVARPHRHAAHQGPVHHADHAAAGRGDRLRHVRRSRVLDRQRASRREDAVDQARQGPGPDESQSAARQRPGLHLRAGGGLEGRRPRAGPRRSLGARPSRDDGPRRTTRPATCRPRARRTRSRNWRRSAPNSRRPRTARSSRSTRRWRRTARPIPPRCALPTATSRRTAPFACGRCFMTTASPTSSATASSRPSTRPRDGAPALVDFDVKGRTYIVGKVLDRGYLAIGRERLPFVREAR